MGGLAGTRGNGAELPATRGLKRPRVVEVDDGGGIAWPGVRCAGGAGEGETGCGLLLGAY